MSTLDRIGSILKANINGMLDDLEEITGVTSSEKPDLSLELQKIRQETAAVMAAETSAKRKLKEAEELIQKCEHAIARAKKSGNEEDVKSLNLQKLHLEAQRDQLESNLSEISDCVVKMKSMYEKLEKDMQEIKRGQSMEKAREHISGFYTTKNSAEHVIDMVNAYSELIEKEYNENTKPSVMADAYDEKQETSKVDQELEALKASLNLDREDITEDDPTDPVLDRES